MLNLDFDQAPAEFKKNFLSYMACIIRETRIALAMKPTLDRCAVELRTDPLELLAQHKDAVIWLRYRVNNDMRFDEQTKQAINEFVGHFLERVKELGLAG